MDWADQRAVIPSRSHRRWTARKRAAPNFWAHLARSSSGSGAGSVARPWACTKEPVELFDLSWRQWGGERIADGIAIQRRRLQKSARDEEADRPFVDRREEVGMAQEKQPELGGHLARVTR